MSQEQQEVEKSTEQSTGGAMPFVLDLNGPFVLHLSKGSARIYAPPCPDHYGNFITDMNDEPIFGLPQDAAKPDDGKGWLYQLDLGPRQLVNNSYNDPYLLKLTYPLPDIPETSCSFVLLAPMPDTIVSLHPEQIWIHQAGANRWIDNPTVNPNGPSVVQPVNGPRARGLRLVYQKCNVHPRISVKNSPSVPNPPDFSLMKFVTQGLTPTYYSLTLRFAANHATPDDHEEDAYSCFQTMRKLVSGADPKNWDIDQWRVDFDHTDPVSQKAQPHLEQKTGPHPYDCGATPLVIQDN
jgi:hypothetical protein